MEETEIVIDEVFPADSSEIDFEPAVLLHALFDKGVGMGILSQRKSRLLTTYELEGLSGGRTWTA